jgi:hypothetical protein
MPCLIGCLALFMPRVVIVLMLLFSDYLEEAYKGVSFLWPLLGFLFLPLTTIAYAFAWHQGGGQIEGLGLAAVVLAVLFDLGLLGTGGASGRRWRKPAE